MEYEYYIIRCITEDYDDDNDNLISVKYYYCGENDWNKSIMNAKQFSSISMAEDELLYYNYNLENYQFLKMHCQIINSHQENG